MWSRRFVRGVCLVLAMVVWVGRVPAAPLLSFDQVLDGGTLAYGGAGGALQGTTIRFDLLLGSDTPAQAGVVVDCLSCVVQFTTGSHLATTGPLSTWAGGGAVTLTGTAAVDSTPLAAGTLFAGSWDSPVVGLRQGAQFNLLGTGSGTVHTALGSFFGLPAVPWHFAASTLSTITRSTGTGFTATVTEADLTTTAPTPTPEPATLLLLGLGLTGLAGWRWRQGQTRTA